VLLGTSGAPERRLDYLPAASSSRPSSRGGPEFAAVDAHFTDPASSTRALDQQNLNPWLAYGTFASSRPRTRARGGLGQDIVSSPGRLPNEPPVGWGASPRSCRPRSLT
jgi:hypothetical protein